MTSSEKYCYLCPKTTVGFHSLLYFSRASDVKNMAMPEGLLCISSLRYSFIFASLKSLSLGNVKLHV